MHYRTGRETGRERHADEPNAMVDIVAREALLPVHVTPRVAIEVVMGALVDRLTGGQAHLILQAVPSSLHSLFEIRVREREGRPTLRLDRAELLARVGGELGVAPAHAEQICAAVFSAARDALPSDIQDHVEAQLPHDLKELWRTPVGAISPAWTDVGEAARHELETEIDRHVALPPGVTSAAAFSAVMCAFSERLSGGEARDVVLSLPESLRPLVDQCLLHRGEPGIVFGRDGLIDRVAEHLAVDQEDALPVIRGVFATVKRILPSKEVNDVTSQLPTDLRDLWQTA